MKILKFFEMMKNNSLLRKNLKYLIIIGVGGIIVVGGLFVYLSFYVVNHAVNLGKNFNFPAVTKNIQMLSTVECRDKALSLFNAGSWVDTSPSENLLKLKQVCLEEKPKICKTQECNEQRQINNLNKGEYI